MALSSEVETGIYPPLQEALCLILGISFEKDLASPPPPLSVGRTCRARPALRQIFPSVSLRSSGGPPCEDDPKLRPPWAEE